ncbi:MAG: amidohydrolase [Bacilli bacterium]|nr:amidohydrolase [Bacilli bacterium]
MILYNGKIYTLDNKQIVQAVKIKRDRIIKTGTNSEILSMKEPNELVIDLRNKTVLPGFNDSHMHLYGFGKHLDTVNLLKVTSVSDIIEEGRKFIEERNIPPYQWIQGRGWNQDYFQDNKRYPTKADLDKISTNHPIIFYRVCGHIAVVNSKALEVCNINENTKQVDGGEFNYELGIFQEKALNLITDKIPKPTVTEIKATLIKALTYANSKGLTSIQSDDLSHAGSFKDVLQAYHELHDEEKLTCRIYEQCLLSKSELATFLDLGYKTGVGDYLFKIGPLKILSDGTLGARTAALRKPYNDNPNTKGMLCYAETELEDFLHYAHENGMQIAIHCIGDYALDVVLKSFAKLPRLENRRHGIVHCQITDYELIERMKKFHLCAYIQPIFLNYDLHIVEDRVGKTLATTSYAFKTLLNQGIYIALGTDCPVELINPLPNIYCAVTRSDLEGFPKYGWNPQEKLSTFEAVYAYTMGSAYTEFQESIKGSITENKLADLVVLAEDLFNVSEHDIKDIEVLMTIMGGEIVYNNYF